MSPMWGKHRENGIWVSGSPRRRWRVLFRGHDSLFIAAGRLRIRIMKPRKPDNSFESRVQDALHAAADVIEPGQGLGVIWARILGKKKP